MKDPRWDTVHTVIPLFNWERSRLIHSAAMNSIHALSLMFGFDPTIPA